MNRVILIIAGFFLFLKIPAQKPLGTWTSYLPYGRASNVAVTDEKVFCSTMGGAFFYNKSDNSIHKFSREDGLSDTEISALAWSPSSNTLIITYTSANIDLLLGNEIINIPDIERKQMLGEKNIFSVYVEGDKAYLATGFGIVLLDLQRHEIKETYYIGEGGESVRVNDITIHDNFLYAATARGIYMADLNSSNLIDFNNWQKQVNLPEGSYNAIASSDTRIYASLSVQEGNDVVYYNEDENWMLYSAVNEHTINDLTTDNNNLIVAGNYNIRTYNSSGSLLFEAADLFPAEVVADEEGIYWIADKQNGLVRLEQNDRLYLKPDGPAGLNVATMEHVNNRLIAVAGGINTAWNNLFRHGEIYTYENNEWSNWESLEVRDLLRIETDPADHSHYFISSWGYGLLELRDGEIVNHYTVENSSLQTVIEGGDYVRLGGMAFDRDGNLWVANSGVPEPLSVLKRNGEWKSFEIASYVNSPNIGEMIYTDDGSLWMILPRGYGLFVYNPNGTPDNADDDIFKKVSVVDENNKIITNDIYSIAQDHDGNIWLGTNEGVLVYYSPSRVFNNNSFYASIPFIPREDGEYVDPLLGTETVTAIAVDGANRKWFGTRNAGVFLVSEDGQKQIKSFNSENSPLLSNSISDIVINDETGEVFFATGKGIISYMSDARGASAEFSDVYVYPNPVRENYFGDIVVTGLVEDTYVKITDLNGNLVHETRSLGGNAIWNGNNLSGERVSTGVYLVFCTNEDGSLTHVAKLLFIH